MNRVEKKVVVLFSGGCDSVLTSAFAAEKFPDVYLVTYRRLGLFKADKALINLKKLKEKYPKNNFYFNLINIDKFFKKVCYQNYLGNIYQFGSMVLSVCALCKLSMHWRTILFCLQTGAVSVYDGTVEEEFAKPGFLQERQRKMKQILKDLYFFFGIDYFCPLYNYKLKEIELQLVDTGLMPEKNTRQAGRKAQPVCASHMLNMCFGDYYLRTHSRKEFVERSIEFYKSKINYVREEIKKKINEKD